MTGGMLKPGQVLIARNMESAATIEELIGEGAQAEVYRARIGNAHYALKWYRPQYLSVDQKLWERLKVAIHSGSPTDQFLWPFDLVAAPRQADYGGYIMPLKPPEFVSMVDLLRRRAEPSFRALTWVGFHLAHSFLKLHAAGLCYRDVNFGNVFFNPETGDIRIADTDNVDVNLRSGSIKGTPGFMAPEVAKNQVQPNAMSDRYSLAILLFFIFMLGHPLKGRRELTLPYDAGDPDKTQRLCEEEPVFVFDPDNDTNRPVPGEHDPLLSFWPIYPTSLHRLFIRAFTRGIYDQDARVMENEWRVEMGALRDSLFICDGCTAENFFDLDLARQSQPQKPCWSCGKALANPPRMRLGMGAEPQILVLIPGLELYPHHLEGDAYNFSRALGRVSAEPLALHNLSPSAWSVVQSDGAQSEIPPGGAAPLVHDCIIRFGRAEARVRMR